MKPFQNLTGRGRARRLRRLALNALKLYDLEVERLSLVTNGLLNFVLQNHELLDMNPTDFAMRTERRLHLLMGI